jgi:hypothetical protein
MTTGVREALVTIDGKPIDDAQVATIRVAVSHFLRELVAGEAEALGPIGPLYMERCREVESMLVDAGNRPDRVAAWREL